MAANGGDDRLEVVTIFSRHPNLFILNLGGDFNFGVADEAGDLFGDGRFNSLLDLDGLAGMTER